MGGLHQVYTNGRLPWASYEFTALAYGSSLGLTMGLPLEYTEIAEPCVGNGSPMGHPWIAHESPMGLPLVHIADRWVI